MKKISYVIPCYGSEKTIAKVVATIDATMADKSAYDYEIILVNDCSPDGVWDEINRITREDNHVKGICLAKNFGQHNALMAGYAFVTGDIVVSLDDDGQSPVEHVFKLIDKIENDDIDVAFSTTPIRKENWYRRIGSRVNNIMAEVLIDKPKGLWFTSFFAAKRFIINEMIKYDNPYAYVEGLIFRATKKVCGVEIQQYERLEGKSGYSFAKLIALWMNGFTAFSVLPLRFATICGGICAMSGFVYAIITFVRKLVNPNIVLGYSSLMCAILFIGGMVMLMLGTIGEYIGRIYISLNKSPQYVIRETTDKE